MKKKNFIKQLFLGLSIMLFAFYTMNAQSTQSSVVLVSSATTAETDAANPDALDPDANDVQILKTADGSGDREAYVKFDISNVDTENLTYVSLSLMGDQHNFDEDLINPYYVEMYTCEETDWSREDLTWNAAATFNIGANPLSLVNVLDFETYRFYSPELINYIVDQKESEAQYVAFKFMAKEVHPFNAWLTGAWQGMELELSYTAPSIIIPSETTAEVDEANPTTLDPDPNDIQVWKQDGGNREAFVKFDIGAASTDDVKYAVVSCVGAQHNFEEEMADPYWVEIYTCAETDWSRDDLTWNTAKDFTIGENPLASVNVMGFATYAFYSQAIADYIKQQKDAGVGNVAFKFVAKDEQPFDAWLSGQWMGFELKLYDGDVNVEPIQDFETSEAYAADPDAADDDYNDIKVQRTSGGSADYEGFVSFDVTSIEKPNLTYASISFKGGQHAPDDVEEINKFIVDLLPLVETEWVGSEITWNNTRGYKVMANPVASVHIGGSGDYEFNGEALAGYINTQLEAGATHIAFKMAGRDELDWNVWLSGDWNGMQLNYSAETTVEEIAPPVFSHQGGEYETSPEITLTSETDGAAIFYTLDGSTPSTESTEYTGAFTLSEGTIEVKAISIKDGIESPVVAHTYTIGNPNTTPDNNTSNSKKLELYPNPVQDQLSIQFEVDGAFVALIEILDVLGSSHMHLTRNMTSGMNNFTLNTSNLESGLYFVKIYNKTESYTRKIMVK